MGDFTYVEQFQFSYNGALFRFAEGILTAPMGVEPKDCRLGQRGEKRLDVVATVALEKSNVLAIAKSFYSLLMKRSVRLDRENTLEVCRCPDCGLCLVCARFNEDVHLEHVSQPKH
jgi:hypothetical protein